MKLQKYRIIFNKVYTNIEVQKYIFILSDFDLYF